MVVDELTEQSLALLRRDGRASFSDIARKLGTNRANIAKRLNPLLSSGDIRIVAAVHPRLLGLQVLAHVSIRAEGSTADLSDRICELDTPVFVSEITGQYQLVTELHTASMGELQAEVRRIRALAGVIELQVIIYERMLQSFFLGEEPQILKLDIDNIDLKLMELLQDDGRLGYAELGEKVGLSISGCRTRINRLTETGAMRIGLLRERVNATGQLVFGFGFSTVGDPESVIAMVDAQPGTEFMARTVGRFDFVATIEFSGLHDFNVFTDAVRSLPEVRILDQWLHAQIRKERYQHSLHRIRDEDVDSTRVDAVAEERVSG